VFLSCVDDDGALLSTHALQMCMLPFSDSYQDAGTVGLGSIDTDLGRAMVVSRDQ
jgi:hypothetical protein